MRANATPSLTAGLLTDVGRQRQGGVNQDAALALDLPTGGLYAVADGMGGHAAGELAANLALDALSQQYLDGRGTPPARLAEAVQCANVAVLRHAVGEYVGMGTTLLAALIDRGAALIAHVGDSRAYLLRGGELHRLTEDHSWVAEQVRLGHMTEAEARDHQWRSVVSNALGGEERVRLELFGLPLRAGDRLLLCSDGLSSVVTDQELLLLLSRPMEPEATARILVNAANDGGGPDNITALIIDVHRDSPAPRYPLPVRREDGPTYVDVLLSTQRGSSLLTYLLLMVAYFTLLGIMLVPERRMLIGLLGTATLLGLLVWQRTQVTRRTLNVLKSPSAALDPAPPAPDSPLSSSRH
ncbi:MULTISPECIES: protein phosphatase 2C domain-containing protein [unclassified Deinococcus]|jgi:protein phosphatase|uniref:PP2C family protein-serine/threonine phosphatase n=1 Tax=unclassified Deinococcus TaxID=2623546 RepID=UPI000994864C|nr:MULTISPECIES: protein phosphatase 2C domain-containing protein [unclassified Deinococcus]MBX8466177.1 protein phosphatase 2C domain-containing protein [Deinococcus sp. RIT780]MCD0157368.1 serine/threonine-protein phosphatase [Deinococcus sp. 6GRE01]PIG96709.1 serine/threonine-protein phosphatase [Deinococcus sp. UR1]